MIKRQKEALRMKRRHWWVCCYAYKPERVQVGGNAWKWKLWSNAWGSRRTRRWQLIDIKTFTSPATMQASNSLQRLYEPFNHPNAFVVAMRRTEEDITWLTEYNLSNYSDE